MTEYYVIRNKDTGLYFRGKGVNRWGEYFNQASIYRIKGMAEHVVKEIAWHDEKAEVVPILISEVKSSEWIDGLCDGKHRTICSNCGSIIPTDTQVDFLTETDNRFCYWCGQKMNSQ